MYITPDLCPSCGKPLQSSSDLYEIDGLFVCEKCFREWLADYAKTNAVEIAAKVDVPVMKYSEAFGG